MTVKHASVKFTIQFATSLKIEWTHAHRQRNCNISAEFIRAWLRDYW